MKNNEIEKNQIQGTFYSRNPFVKRANERFFSLILQLVQEAKAKKILDCGCGEGLILEYLSKNLNHLEIFGFDINKKALVSAKKIIPRGHFKDGSIYQIPFVNNFAPLILCTEVLEHLERPQQALAELKRVSASKAIIAVPHEPFFRLANVARLAYLKKGGNTPGHINHWTSASFKKFLEEFFQFEKILYPFPWMVFLVKKKD